MTSGWNQDNQTTNRVSRLRAGGMDRDEVASLLARDGLAPDEVQTTIDRADLALGRSGRTMPNDATPAIVAEAKARHAVVAPERSLPAKMVELPLPMVAAVQRQVASGLSREVIVSKLQDEGVSEDLAARSYERIAQTTQARLQRAAADRNARLRTARIRFGIAMVCVALSIIPIATGGQPFALVATSVVAFKMYRAMAAINGEVSGRVIARPA